MKKNDAIRKREREVARLVKGAKDFLEQSESGDVFDRRRGRRRRTSTGREDDRDDAQLLRAAIKRIREQIKSRPA